MCYIFAVIAIFAVLTWLSYDSISYQLHDSQENLILTLWQGSIYAANDVFQTPRSAGRFELSLVQVTGMSGSNVSLWLLGVLSVAIPSIVVAIVIMVRHWWRVAENVLKQKAFVILLVAAALLVLSRFAYVNILKVTCLYEGRVGIGWVPFTSWFVFTPIEWASHEFQWLPAVEQRVLYLPIWLIALVLWLTNYGIAVRRKPQDGSSCVECGYDLKGNVSGKCPECGTPIASIPA